MFGVDLKKLSGLSRPSVAMDAQEAAKTYRKTQLSQISDRSNDISDKPLVETLHSDDESNSRTIDAKRYAKNEKPDAN